MLNVYGYALNDDGLYDNMPNAWNWVYFHGDLQNANGYDLCALDTYDDIPESEGIYECKVYLHNGEERKGIVYLWEPADDTWKTTLFQYKGLIVDADDVSAISYAKVKYEEKPWHI